MLLVEDPHHDRLSADHGQRRDPDVYVPAVDRERHPTVLRGAPLGDVEVGHDLDPRDQARHQLAGNRGRVDHHAVYPIADLRVLQARIEVDVGGAAVGGVGDHGVDQLHHRGLLGRGAQVEDPCSVGF